MVPEYMVKEWAQYTYADPTDYWTFRKQVNISAIDVSLFVATNQQHYMKAYVLIGAD